MKNAFLKELAREICAGRDLQFEHPGRYDSIKKKYIEMEGRIDIWHEQRQEESFTLKVYECENEDIIEVTFTDYDSEQFSTTNLDPAKIAKYMFELWAEFLKKAHKEAEEMIETTAIALKEVEKRGLCSPYDS